MHAKLECLLSKSLTTLEVMAYYLVVHTGPALLGEGGGRGGGVGWGGGGGGWRDGAAVPLCAPPLPSLRHAFRPGWAGPFITCLVVTFTPDVRRDFGQGNFSAIVSYERTKQELF